MFVKIINKSCEALYECERLYRAPRDFDTIVLTMEGPKGSVSIDVNCDEEHTAVFLMNNDGKTIDTIFKNY